MARSLEHIAKDLSALATTTAAIDTKLQDLYGQYLEVLGTAVRRQLVLAAYHLCTEVYPEAFLALSMGQREKLQRVLRQLADQGRSHIQALTELDNVSATLRLLLQSSEGAIAFSVPEEPENLEEQSEESEAEELEEPEEPERLLGEELLGEELSPQAWAANLDADSDADSDAGSDAGSDPDAVDTNVDDQDRGSDRAPNPPSPDSPDGAPSAAEDIPDNGPGVVLPEELRAMAAAQRLPPEAMVALSAALSAANPTAPSPLSLAKRHVLLERQIRAVLHSLSTLANSLLKQAQILPDLPEEVLSAAAESDGGDGPPATPNLLSVIVEMGHRPDRGDEDDGDDDDEEDEEDDEDDEDFGAGDDEAQGGDEDDDFRDSDDDPPERSMTHLVAINLRLGDIEFADSQAALRRSKLRETLGRLKILSRRYQKLQREQAQAEAAAAWRSTWFDDGQG